MKRSAIPNPTIVKLSELASVSTSIIVRTVKNLAKMDILHLGLMLSVIKRTINFQLG